MTLAIPNEQTITVEWFNRCFERCGIDATVSGFDAERVGTGQIGKCIRLNSCQGIELEVTDRSNRT